MIVGNDEAHVLQLLFCINLHLSYTYGLGANILSVCIIEVIYAFISVVFWKLIEYCW